MTLKIVNAFEAGDRRKAVAILDIEAWATHLSNFGKGYEHTGYFNRKYIPRKGVPARRFKLTNPITIERFATLMYY
jgi:hypothetical protein